MTCEKLEILGKTTITNWTRPKLDVACVIDIPTYRSHREGAERERVFEDVKFACGGIPDSVVHHIQFDRLDFGVGEVLDKFYAADVAIIDLSVQVRKTEIVCYFGIVFLPISLNSKQHKVCSFL